MFEKDQEREIKRSAMEVSKEGRRNKNSENEEEESKKKEIE